MSERLALLAAMSLVGMMIKNAIVLLDEVNLNLGRGMNRYEAVEEAAVSRLRPVVLAAATTVLGVIPLLQDVFWIGLAVTIMAGLTVGTVLTMVLAPVLYAAFLTALLTGEGAFTLHHGKTDSAREQTQRMGEATEATCFR